MGRHSLSRLWTVSLAALCLLVAGCAQSPRSSTSTADLVMEEFMIPGADPGVQLYVRNKRPRGLTSFKPDNIALFVHGGTYPSETGFDLRLEGWSWMDHMAARGFDVYLVEIRGYGRSSRPPEMEQPPAANGPIVNTATAARDYGAAVDFIRARRGVDKINALAHSWGCSITATFTSQNNEKVNRLVLFAPQWIRTRTLTDPGGAKLGAYRTVTVDAARKRKDTGIAPGRNPMPDAWFEAWVKETFNSDPKGATASPKYVRAPNGVIQDNRDYWLVGKPIYDPAAIRVPTLVIVGEWDADTPIDTVQAMFPTLVNAAPKRLVIVGGGTHSLMLEKNRMQLFREVQTFLEEPRD